MSILYSLMEQSPADQDDSNQDEATDSSTDVESSALTLEIKTVLGTIIALTGFILQFIGLRGMHWSASTAQLGAVLVMVFLKAWVRRGLATPPQALALSPGYELDWLVKTLGKLDEAPWAASKGDATGAGTEFARRDRGKVRSGRQVKKENGSSTCVDWIVMSRGSAQLEQLGQNRVDIAASATLAVDPCIPVQGAAFDVQAVLDARQELGSLADWSGPAFAEAVSLARAVGITLNAIVGSSMIHPSSSNVHLRDALVPFSQVSPPGSPPPGPPPPGFSLDGSSPRISCASHPSRHPSARGHSTRDLSPIGHSPIQDTATGDYLVEDDTNGDHAIEFPTGNHFGLSPKVSTPLDRFPQNIHLVS